VRLAGRDATVLPRKHKDIAMNAIIDRREVRAEEIRFAVRSFSLGTVLVAISRGGVVAILMGDDGHALWRELVNALPWGHLVADERGLEDCVKTVVAFLEAPQDGLNLPLDIRGSALQLAVWKALRDVPAGQTTTYGHIAKALPLSATAQEVGAACAANVLAVAIPCHRVVKADGAISGYRWGVQRKRKLIDRELAR
jgi:AraC family transcriptional regulator of adaptative response/methylated-DNA-[protein]-cysteine methyltransferase